MPDDDRKKLLMIGIDAGDIDWIRSASAALPRLHALLEAGPVLDLQIHVGSEVADLAGIVNALRLQRLAGDCDDGQRSVLQCLLAASRRDDDLL